jgi:hypothetical protein
MAPTKGEGEIRGDNAQFTDERTHQCHWETSLVHVAVRNNAETSKPFPAEKVSLAALSPFCTPEPLRQRG